MQIYPSSVVIYDASVIIYTYYASISVVASVIIYYRNMCYNTGHGSHVEFQGREEKLT